MQEPLRHGSRGRGHTTTGRGIRSLFNYSSICDSTIRRSSAAERPSSWCRLVALGVQPLYPGIAGFVGSVSGDASVPLVAVVQCDACAGEDVAFGHDFLRAVVGVVDRVGRGVAADWADRIAEPVSSFTAE